MVLLLSVIRENFVRLELLLHLSKILIKMLDFSFRIEVHTQPLKFAHYFVVYCALSSIVNTQF